jgi:hypothetical protein
MAWVGIVGVELLRGDPMGQWEVRGRPQDTWKMATVSAEKGKCRRCRACKTANMSNGMLPVISSQQTFSSSVSYSDTQNLHQEHLKGKKSRPQSSRVRQTQQRSVEIRVHVLDVICRANDLAVSKLSAAQKFDGRPATLLTRYPWIVPPRQDCVASRGQSSS